MLTDAQMAEGTLRLSGGKLTASDSLDLLTALRTWLGVRSREFSDLQVRLNSAVSPVSDKLAGVLILMKKLGFSVTNIDGGRLGIKSSKDDKRALMAEYALGLMYDLPSDLKFDLPGSFSTTNVPTW